MNQELKALIDFYDKQIKDLKEESKQLNEELKSLEKQLERTTK